MANINFDYFTAAEAEQYTFYRIPKALFTDGHFQALSCEAKVLYGMMLDRISLSIRNQWFDSQGRAYIIFTVEDVMSVMGCQSQKAVRLMKELDTVDGIGLIEKKRIGLGRPNRIYVKNFMVRGDGGTDPQAGNGDRTGRKASDDPCNAGVSERKGTPSADMSGCGEPEALEKESLKKTAAGLDTAGCREKAELEKSAEPEKNNAGNEENWWMCGETVSGYENSLEKAAGVQETNWWDTSVDVCPESSGWQKSAGNMPGDVKMEAGDQEHAAFWENPVTENNVENVDNVDKYIENQNSIHSAYFSRESEAVEKGCGCTMPDMPEHTVHIPETAAARTAGRKAGNSRKKEGVVFADKTIEAMVRGLLWQEDGTGTDGSSPEQEPQACIRQEFPEPQNMECEKQDSVIVDAEALQSWNAKRNNTENNNIEYSETENSKKEINETDFSDSYQSYQSHQSNLSGRQFQAACCGQDGCDPDADGNRETDSIEGKMDAYRAAIRENISYSCFNSSETGDVDELVELMVDAMMVPDKHTIRVAGMEKPASVVKSRFMKLVHSHIEYVMECLQKHTGKIWNIKSYLLTALYNSSLTISSYYRAEVNHDLYGGVC